MRSKRGQGLSTNAIVLMVLGVIILVVLAVGFTIGFSKLNPFLGSNNVNAIVTSCSIACSTNSIHEFCSLERTLKADDLPSGEDEVRGTCFDFSKTPYTKYGIGSCSEVNCGRVGGSVYDSLAELKLECVESGAGLRYLDGDIEQTYSCLTGDLALSRDQAGKRCSQENNEVIEWFDTTADEVKSYFCGSGDKTP